MNFPEFWLEIQSQITPGTQIKNWTAAKGFLGDEFRIHSVSSLALEIDSPNAELFQRVSRKDFEFMWTHWNLYVCGEMKRGELVKNTRVSKYTMSILKHVLG